MNFTLFNSDTDFFAAKLINSWIKSYKHDFEFALVMEVIDEDAVIEEVMRRVIARVASKK